MALGSGTTAGGRTGCSPGKYLTGFHVISSWLRHNATFHYFFFWRVGKKPQQTKTIYIFKTKQKKANKQNNKSQLRFPVLDFTSRLRGTGADGVTAAPKRNYPEPAWDGARSPGPAPGPAAAADPPFSGRHLAGQAAAFPSAGAEQCPAGARNTQERPPGLPGTRGRRRVFAARAWVSAGKPRLRRGGRGPQPSGREPEPLC